MWSRARREIGAQLHGVAFVIAETVGGAVVAVVSQSAVWVLVYVVGLLLLMGARALLATPVFQRDEARERLRLTVASPPVEPTAQLSFGRAEIPPESQMLLLRDATGELRLHKTGRVIRVPVSNRPGAAEARGVHARLRFLAGGKSDVPFVPSETQAEWPNEHGGHDLEVDIPANGRPHMLDVVAILDDPYPHAYEWTDRSRFAILRGYAIQARPFDVEILLHGITPGTALTRTLRIDPREGDAISAEWHRESQDEPSNAVPWPVRHGAPSVG